MGNFFKLLFICMLLGTSSLYSKELNSFYPQEIINLNKEILSPEQFLGCKMGTQHLTYESVYNYMRYLASVSKRVELEIKGNTYENRPVVSLAISSEKNINKLDMVRGHNTSGLLVNWLGYSVHGNEASGVNASVIMAYLLAASEDKYVQNILDKTVVVIIPALNPDGVSRYANWVNSNISYAINKDGYNRESKEPAPSSRSNHYWFDLNRDWLFAQQPEIQAVLRAFHEWNPHIVNDFHEQGFVSGTYFSPGIKTSNNPLLDKENWELTDKMSEFHDSYMERVGNLYFSREGYDNFYTGKGAAYPSLFGSIGILYEQPNSKGLVRIEDGVEISLANMIRNQVYCSFSSLVGGVALKDNIFAYHKKIADANIANSVKNPNEAYVFNGGADISLLNEFLNVLDAHHVKYYRLKENVSGKLSNASASFAVPLSQENPDVIRTIFEKQLDYIDTTFYDISAWTVPLAFNISYSKTKVASSQMEDVVVLNSSALVPAKSDYAYVFGMDDYYSYNFLYYLLNNGVFLKASDRTFTFNVNGSDIDFGVGSIIVPVVHQSFGSDKLYEIIANYFKMAPTRAFPNTFERGFVAKGVVNVYALSSGRGVDFDLGSPKFSHITLPSIAIITGKGGNYGTIGELWHLLDQRFRIPVTLLDYSLISAGSLAKYNVIVCTNDFKMEANAKEELAKWAQNNMFIAVEEGVKFAAKSGIAKIELKSLSREVDSLVDSYIYRRDSRRVRYFSGVILNSLIDVSNPLSCGVNGNNGVGKVSLPVLKENNYIAMNVKGSLSVFSTISTDPLMSGYLSNYSTKVIAGSPYIVSKKGFVFFPDSPYFRAYWLGTSRIFMNALFFRELF